MLNDNKGIMIAAASNQLEISNVEFNVEEIINCLDNAKNKGIKMICFPEISLCANSCYDLFFTEDLLNSVLNGLKTLKEYSKQNNMLFIVGAPLKINDFLYNCAISISGGKIIGVTPKINISKRDEILSYRYFESGKNLNIEKVLLLDEEVNVSSHFVYKLDEENSIKYSVFLGEDLYNDSCIINDSQIVFHPSCDANLIGTKTKVKNKIKEISKKYSCICVHANSSSCESSSNVTYDGYLFISKANGEIYEDSSLTFTSKILSMNFGSLDEETIIEDNISAEDEWCELDKLTRDASPTPFAFKSSAILEEILNIQTLALARRIKQLNGAKMILGISGGSDSTLAFLVCLRAKKLLNMKDEDIIGVTMPGFGTSKRTYNNSLRLIQSANALLKEISIVEACIQHYKDIGHDINDYDITYENAQARERTQILFDLANDLNGIVVGTGDLSEMVLGWATYNGDQMSNYGVNIGIPKTLVLSLIEKVKNDSDGQLKEVLQDILNTPISPELLPLDEFGNIVQDSQKSVGPYRLHDFFIYHFLGYGIGMKQLYYLACKVFKDEYDKEHIKATLRIFIKRLFTQQFKRNALADGVKVFDIGLNAKMDLILSSDGSYMTYLKELEEL